MSRAMDGEIWKPIAEVSSPHCPRCASSNTKFCYYNNYSLTQPRYFCKACRRYWTKGGSLRNVPVGGGCRRNKTSHKSSLCSSNDHHRVAFKKSSNSTLVEQHTISSSSIDLALVYADFLNHQQPDQSYTSSDINILSNDSKDVYFCQHRIQETSTDNGLPPLPTTELSSSSSTWMNTQVMVSGHNPVQPARFSTENAQDFGIIVDEWIPYDLPNCDAFPPGL